jgi:hypothetical protein
MFKVWLLILYSTLFKDLIFWLNQLQVTSHMFELVVITWKLWDFLVHVVIQECMIHIQVHLCFNFFIQQLHFLSLINNAFIYVLKYEFKTIIFFFDLHIMIASWLQCFKFQHFISYERNNMPWCKPLNHILYIPIQFFNKFYID